MFIDVRGFTAHFARLDRPLEGEDFINIDELCVTRGGLFDSEDVLSTQDLHASMLSLSPDEETVLNNVPTLQATFADLATAQQAGF